MLAVRASKCYIYIRGEYVEPWQSVQRAINEAYKAGFIGKNVLGSGLDFDVYTHLGAGSYECGEESALISSLMGERGMPRMKAPSAPLYTISGAGSARPPVNNVETIATVPAILSMGGAEYAKIGYGSPRSAGTKLTAISGHVRKPGVYEITLGTPMREVIYDIAGGIRDGHELKTYIPGGSSTASCCPNRSITRWTTKGVVTAGAMLGLGSGGLIVLDETTPIVPVTKRLVTFITTSRAASVRRAARAWVARQDLRAHLRRRRARAGH
jgi:NADH-quinone oxidoreductase subunit F